MINLSVYIGSGSSGAHNPAPVDTSFCHDQMSTRALFLTLVVVLHFFQSYLLPLDLLMWLLQFSCTLLLSGERIHCFLFPLEKHSLLMVKQMLVVDFSE